MGTNTPKTDFALFRYQSGISVFSLSALLSPCVAESDFTSNIIMSVVKTVF